MDGTTKERAIVAHPSKGENWQGKLTTIYNFLYNQKKGPLLYDLKRPECGGEEVLGHYSSNEIWHFGYIRWLGLEIWVKVQGTKKSAKEAAVKEFMERYDRPTIERMAKMYVDSGKVPQAEFVSAVRGVHDRLPDSARESNSENEKENLNSTPLSHQMVNSDQLAPTGICILIDLEAFGILASSRINEILEENEAHPICEIKGFCGKGFDLQLNCSFVVEVVEDHLEEIPDVLLSLEVGRRVDEFKEKKKIKTVFIVASYETARILTSHLRNENVLAFPVSSEEEFNECMNLYIESSGVL